jgi:hypothetical protein
MYAHGIYFIYSKTFISASTMTLTKVSFLWYMQELRMADKDLQLQQTACFYFCKPWVKFNWHNNPLWAASSIGMYIFFAVVKFQQRVQVQLK